MSATITYLFSNGVSSTAVVPGSWGLPSLTKTPPWTLVCFLPTRAHTHRQTRGVRGKKCLTSPPMAAAAAALLAFVAVAGALVAQATDPYVFFDWDVSFITASPLGLPQKVLLLLLLLAKLLLSTTSNSVVLQIKSIHGMPPKLPSCFLHGIPPSKISSSFFLPPIRAPHSWDESDLLIAYTLH